MSPAGRVPARELVRDIGLRRAVRVAPGWLVARRFHVVAGRVDADVAVAVPPGARCDVLRGAELPAFARACPGMPPREVHRRWAEGQVCLVCWIGGEVAAYRWDAVGPVYLPYLGRRLRGAAGDVVTVDARTLPGCRRAGAGTLLMQAGLHRAHAQGARRLVGLVAVWNQAALAWADRVNWARVGAVGYRRAPWGRQYFVEGAVRLAGDEVVLLAEPDPAGTALGVPTPA